MITLQEDLLDLYNSLVSFSAKTLDQRTPCPLTISFKEEENTLVVEQGGDSIRLRLPLYYCLGLDTLKKPSYLLPRDYDYLMSTLQSMISSGILLADRTCISPENYGFDVYAVDLKQFKRGTNIVGKIRLVSGTGWFFRLYTKYKFRKCLK